MFVKGGHDRVSRFYGSALEYIYWERLHAYYHRLLYCLVGGPVPPG